MSVLRTVIAILQLLGGLESGSLQAAAPPHEEVIHIRARRFEYQPSEIVLRKSVPVIIELESEDRTHGFAVPELGLRVDVAPGAPGRVRFTPDRVGRFGFHCDVFCGSGHEDMTGEIVVTD